MKRNDLLSENSATVLRFTIIDNNESWKMVMDAVDYPVEIVNAYYKKDGEFHNANGATKAGRDKHYNLVLVDKMRTGNFRCIASVTGMYGTMPTRDVFAALQNQLEVSGEKHQVDALYVSGNGGVQQLDIKIPNKQGAVAGENLTFLMRLTTSVDGTKNHTLSAIAVTDYGVHLPLYGGEWNVAVRHTTTIEERSIDFIPTFGLMMQYWDTQIIPMMMLLSDKSFDRNFAVDLLESICEKASIGERHRIRIRQLYESEQVRTNRLQ